MKHLFLFILLASIFSLSAKEIVLFEMQVLGEEKITPLRLVVDESGEAHGIRFDDQGKDVFVGVNQIKSRTGAVVMQHEGHELGYLQSSDLDTLRGGNFKLQYVKNVIFKSKGIKQFTLESDGRSWAAFHENNRIKKLFVQPGSMGIKNISLK